jgi:hypothetical protein
MFVDRKRVHASPFVARFSVLFPRISDKTKQGAGGRWGRKNVVRKVRKKQAI